MKPTPPEESPLKSTRDAASLAFTINVAPNSGNAIQFKLLFGSEEFPEYADKYPDIAAVFVNGVNVAFFQNNQKKPLSILAGTAGDFGAASNIQYDGMSGLLTLTARVNVGQNTIRIAIADTNDSLFDSGLFVSDLRMASSTSTGVQLFLDAGQNAEQNNILTASKQDTYIDGKAGNDKLLGNAGNDVLAGGDGNDTLAGAAGKDELNGGVGNDLLKGGAGVDLLFGGTGIDVADFADSALAVRVDLLTGKATKLFSAGTLIAPDDILRGIESLVGSKFKDELFGSDGADALRGGRRRRCP